MATYVIGDLQGCYSELIKLLDQVGLNQEDQVWFTGDLINRGPESLETLRFVRDLGSQAVTVLGNHDLHLLALSVGVDRKIHPTLEPILQAKDCDELLHWLKHQPVLHDDKDKGFVMTHAGIPHIWSIKQARALAQELEQVLQGQECEAFLHQMYGNQPDLWRDDLKGMDRFRAITNYFTRMRFITETGQLEFKGNGPPDTAPDGFAPWFRQPRRTPLKRIQLFGHWAALGFHREHQIIALDSGCVWGNTLTAYRLEDACVFTQACLHSQTAGET